MGGLIDSCKPLFDRYKSEMILLGLAFLIGCVSLLIFFQQKNAEKLAPIITPKMETRTKPEKLTITVDISGAVKAPFVYTLESGARIIDILQKAGGLTEDADIAFVKRSVNYARVLSDQEKIYIPFISDTAEGFVVENKRMLDYTLPNTNVQTVDTSSRVNINSASVLELDQIPGIGPVQSDAIFNARPYSTTEDLVKNSVIKQSVYDKIKGLISVY